MNERKKVLYCSIVLSLFSLLVSVFIEYYPTGVVRNSILMGHRDFFSNIALGCATGALFSICISIISINEYKNDIKSGLFNRLSKIAIYLISLPCRSENRVWLKEEWYFNYMKNHTLELCDDILDECESIIFDIELLMFRNKKNSAKFDSMMNRLRLIKKWVNGTKRSLNYPVVPDLVEGNLATLRCDTEKYIDSMKELFVEVGEILFFTKHNRNKFNNLVKEFFEILDDKIERG